MPAPNAPGPFRPARQLFVLACMDARVNVEDILGLAHGDAHIVRNAGGIVTDDVRRSLLLSQHAMGTREVAIIQHTQCGMEGLDDERVRAEIEQASGTHVGLNFAGFTSVNTSLAQAVAELRAWSTLPHRDRIRGYIYDVTTGTLSEHTAAVI